MVGGGPAGAAAAIAGAQAGLKTLMLERSAQPRAKVGEALHPGVEPLLASMGAAEALDASAARYSGVWVGWNGPPAFQPLGSDAGGSWRGFQVDRELFEIKLYEAAGSAGAELHRGLSADTPLYERGRVVGAILSDGSVVRGRMLIDASGPARWLTRRLRLRTEARSPPLVARYAYHRDEEPDDADPRLSADPTGWTWSARTAPGVRQWVRVDLDGGKAPAPAGLLTPVRGADVTWRLNRRSAGPGWFLAGEAAATVDPTSSKGVIKALTSGLFAGRAAVATLKHGAPEAEGAAAYRAWIERGFEGEVAALAPLYAQLGARGFGDVAPMRPRRLEQAA